MQADYKVKGSSIRSKFDFVRDRFGRAAEQELKAPFEATPGMLPFLDSSMYPFSVYDRINRAIADEFFDGDLARLREVGEYSAQKVLTTVYKAFASGKDFLGFLRRAAVLHQRFYSQGQMIVSVGAEGTSAVIELTGAPEYSEADLNVAAGFYTGAAKLLGLSDIECDFEVGADGARFDLRWDGG